MKKILLVRLSAIGDIVFASPLIESARRAWPDAHIAWLVQPECAGLLDHHPDLDSVIVCPMRHWRRLWRARSYRELATSVATLRAILHGYHFDLAIDLQGLLKSGLLTWLSGAPERVSLGGREGSGWLMNRVVERGGESARIGSEYRHLAATLGWPLGEFRMAAHCGHSDAAFTAELILREGLEEGYAALCPFTTRPQKHWFEPRWSRLAQRVAGELGLVPVLLGAPPDRAAADRIVDDCAERVVNLAGRTSLTEAAALIGQARLLVAVDTGLGHMGIARATPSVLLFGSTCPYLDTGRTDARVIYHQLDCSPCKRRPTCDGRFDCMRSIEVGQVVATAREVMAA